MEEFSEIGRSGTIIQFRHENGRLIKGIVGTSSTCVKILTVACFYSGEMIQTIGIQGMFQPIHAPKPSIMAFMFSDDKGFWGRTCPKCSSYFRSENLNTIMHCPYCTHQDALKNFNTKNQNDFLKAYCEAELNAILNQTNTEINLDNIAAGLADNSQSPWVYKEEAQQSQFECEKCNSVTDILGEYGLCSNCGEHNSNSVIKQKLNALDNRFAHTDATVTDRSERENEWIKFLLQIVSEFDSLANALKRILISFPLTPKRRNDISQLSFQNFKTATEKLYEWTGIDTTKNIAEDDRTFINKMFNKRHLFTHNNGCVDAEYLKNTGDTTVKLNQKVRVRSNEVRRFIDLIKVAVENLTTGFVSMKAQ